MKRAILAKHSRGFLSPKGLKHYLVVIGAAWLACVSASPASGGEFDPAGIDEFASYAAFRIASLDGSFEMEVLLDGSENTFVGRSDPHAEGDAADDGTTVAGGGVPPYPDTLDVVPDACRRPPDWSESPDTRREVHTEILFMHLTDGAVHIRAGQPYYESVEGSPQQRFYRQTIGEVASRDSSGNPDNDFPADSFFNVFVEVEISPELKLYNKTPMVIQSEITEFPPILGLPDTTYIHDPSFGAVSLYDADGLPWGFLLSAGHGGSDVDEFEFEDEDAIAEPALTRPVSFSVDDQTLGLDPAVSTWYPNDVFADQTLAVQQVTTYLSSGATPGNRPDMTNGRWLVGTMGGAAPQFVAGDAINSFSFGRDGTVRLFPPDPLCNPLPGTLHFSVDRNSQGVPCTDVWYSAAENAGDIYISGADPFGRYADWPALPAPRNDNLLAADSTEEGLRPMVTDTGDDNVTGVELDVFAEADPDRDFYYATFTGPSFAGAGATIFSYDPASGPFEPGNLVVFAAPADMGLEDDDVIDALILADYDPDQPCPPAPNLVLDPDLDEALFSLAPGSPSLGGGLSPAHVFYTDFDGTTFVVFATPGELGLLDTDNVDALDIAPAELPPIPSVSEWGLIVLALLGLTVGAVVFGRRRRAAA